MDTPNPIETPLPPSPGQQMGPHPPVQHSVGNQWHSGLFECHQDPINAVVTALLPCVTYGQIAQVMDASEQPPKTQESRASCPLACCGYLVLMGFCGHCAIGPDVRVRLRKRYGLVEAPYRDMVSHMFCPCCSLCQEFRELKSRQLDPALGCAGIVARGQVAAQLRNDAMNKAPHPQDMSYMPSIDYRDRTGAIV